MALKNPVCSTAEPVTNKALNPNPVCPGVVIPYEYPITYQGKMYTRYEKCLRCGKIFPG